MKMKTIILTAIITLASVFSCLSAQEIIPVDSTHLLSKEQKRTQQYVEKLLKSQNNTISLPIEFNSLIGDSLTTTPYELGINWDKAYFIEEEKKCANLLIPLEVEKEDIQSLLNVFRDENGNFYRTIITYKQTQNDTIKEEIIMKSNLDGLFLNAVVLHNEKLVSLINGVVGDYGIAEYKSGSKRNKIVYDRFTSVNPSYQKSFADTYEFLVLNANPIYAKGKLKTPY